MTTEDGWVEVKDSSTIDKFAYNADLQNLVVMFKSGHTYSYYEVPEETAKGFLEAESKGKYFAKSIRNEFDSVELYPLKKEEE